MRRKSTALRESCAAGRSSGSEASIAFRLRCWLSDPNLFLQKHALMYEHTYTSRCHRAKTGNLMWSCHQSSLFMASK